MKLTEDGLSTTLDAAISSSFRALQTCERNARVRANYLYHKLEYLLQHVE